MIHVDFSENYGLKYESEVQAITYWGMLCRPGITSVVLLDRVEWAARCRWNMGASSARAEESCAACHGKNAPFCERWADDSIT